MMPPAFVLRDRLGVHAMLMLYDLEVPELAGRIVTLVPLVLWQLQGPANYSMDDVRFLES